MNMVQSPGPAAPALSLLGASAAGAPATHYNNTRNPARPLQLLERRNGKPYD